MNVDQYRQLLLNKIPTAKIASGGKVINCRCMYCPDSRHASSKHFYISIPPDDKTPSLYYCHLCHNSGVVTYEKLIEWDIFDEAVAIDLINHNKNCSKYTNNRQYFDRKIRMHGLRSITTTDSEATRIKLEYINNRLGCNFSYEELRNLKIVLNLYDLFNDNLISKHQFTRDPSIVDQLDKNFLGFISIDNVFINMRRLCDEGLVYKSIDKRYINYQLINKFDTSERFYTIPTKVNLLDHNRIKIHVAEGPFDILSIYKNVRYEEPGIYTSIGGSNYLGITKYFLERYKISYCEFHFYPDNDKYGARWRFEKIARYLTPLNIPIYLHRNQCEGQKDFGVSSNLINESIERIII